MATATSALVILKTIWKSNKISIQATIHLYKSLVLSIMLYGCETWTLTEDLDRRIIAFETKSYRNILGISYREHKTNVFVYNTIEEIVGKIEHILTTIKRRKMSYFGHVTRHDSLHKTILQGSLRGKRRRGRTRKDWNSNICKWSGMSQREVLDTAHNRKKWRKVCVSSSSHVPPTINRSRD